MRKNYAFIDYENAQPNYMSALQEMGNRAEYIKISSHSSNAQYFHMAFYIGKLQPQNLIHTFI
ncbi:hypothetical protein A1QG_05740 [Vibrio breoganii ZF-29]|nr:hypothetical protein A1QG_05740 [Vibrio breoganii ZF-29]OEF84326.1 hypothetical protein B003_18265 [Vibrio breoganii 1C10]